MVAGPHLPLAGRAARGAESEEAGTGERNGYSMTKLIVDGTEIDVPAEYTLLQACEAAGAEIPRFCFHERLSIAGNCRMCLVEQEKSPKPIASCAMPAADGMVIHTDTQIGRAHV